GIQVVEQLELGLRKTQGQAKATVLLMQARAVTDLAAMAGKNKELLKARNADEAFVAAKNRRRSAMNLREIGVALHNFEAVHRHSRPAALCDAQAKPCLSGRVAILPYIEQGALYQRFKLDEPWDSEHNKKLIAHMPKLYAAPGVKTREAGLTFYQGF